jgi:hypothetical protein
MEIMKRLSKDTFIALSWTWGIIMTLIGFIATKFLNLLGYKTEPNIWGYCTKVGKGWGGVDLGLYCIVSEDASPRTCNHEFGHAIQNCIFGPLFPFIVAIPSACRYWNFTSETKKGNADKLPNYDDAWFEGQATKLGNEYAQRTKDI